MGAFRPADFTALLPGVGLHNWFLICMSALASRIAPPVAGVAAVFTLSAIEKVCILSPAEILSLPSPRSYSALIGLPLWSVQSMTGDQLGVLSISALSSSRALA